MRILKNKNIIITAGPTWVSIDKVRVITNIFGGTLGFIIAKAAHRMGARVTLLIGPGGVTLERSAKNFKIIKFKYFEEILRLMKEELGSKKYDIIIHSAAVADYAPILSKKGKIKSGRKDLTIKLIPTIKIVDLVKKIDPKIFLVKFKLEVGLKKKELLKIAYKSMINSHADLVVANDFKDIEGKHRAFIIDKEKKVIACIGKKDIAQKLLTLVAKRT